VEVKKRRVGEKDWQKVEEKIKSELQKREQDSFRKIHETIWREVDRQVSMQPPKRVYKDAQERDSDWHNAIELGELSRASEIITADVLRLIFPTTRAWFEPHAELPPKLDQNTGQNVAPTQKDQIFVDGALRALMAQQHVDFGFKSRIKLSIKEALHHGSFVAEVRNEQALLVRDGSMVSQMSAPVWVPHSMWNCYPDPSPSVLGTNTFYTGTMILKEYMPLWKLKIVAASNPGWMSSQIKKIPKKTNKNKDVETQDVELVKFIGDCSIERGDGDIFLPNSKIILANGVIVYYQPNELPFSNIIFNGYERLDVRDPYYTSPLIKLSPFHKMCSVLANKYLDAVALRTEPPVVYDANDPQFIVSGGPILAPGVKSPTKHFGKYQLLETGDPNFALQGLQLALDHVQQGTSVDAVRSGAGDSADQTATESRLKSMKGEIRTVDFVDTLEFSCKSYLYMQHEINKREMGMYSFYNPEMDAPDFMRWTKQDLPENVHFDIVGARGILGEEERSQKVSVVTAFASQNPLFANIIKPVEILKEMYADAGVKNPERWLNIPDNETQIIEQRIEAKYQEAMQAHEEEIFKLKQDLAIARAVNDARLQEATIKAETQAAVTEHKAMVQTEVDTVKTGLKIAETQAKVESKKDANS